MATVAGDGIMFDTDVVKPGVRFDTQFETGCVVAEDPCVEQYAGPPRGLPVYGFDAYDSEGVLCRFGTNMVTWIHR